MEWLIFGGILFVAAILRDANRTEQANEHDDLEGNRIHRGNLTGDGGNRDSDSPRAVNRVGDVIPAPVPVVETVAKVEPEKPNEIPVEKK